jgi:acetoin utilization protein AcuB
VGIFSSRDLLASYKELFGVGEKGSVLLGVEDDGQRGLMTRIVTLLEQQEIPVTRLLRIEDAEHGNRIYLRLNTFKIAVVLTLLRQKGFHPIL